MRITPPEEQLESAAARVRPLLLNEELVYHAKVMKAIKGRLPEDAPERMRNAYEEFRERWQSFDSRSREHRGYLVQVESGGDDAPPTQLSDNVLGFAYIYGDTIHADQARLEETGAFGVEHRFMAAVPIVAGIMVLAIATLNLINDMVRSGYLELPEAIRQSPVTVDTTVFRYEAEVFQAPPGTEFPGLDDELGPEWERYTFPPD